MINFIKSQYQNESDIPRSQTSLITSAEKFIIKAETSIVQSGKCDNEKEYVEMMWEQFELDRMQV